LQEGVSQRHPPHLLDEYVESVAFRFAHSRRKATTAFVFKRTTAADTADISNADIRHNAVTKFALALPSNVLFKQFMTRSYLTLDLQLKPKGGC
jgi:hypothetical protein